MMLSQIAKQPARASGVRWGVAVAVLMSVGLDGGLARAADDGGWADWSEKNCDEVLELRAYGADRATPYPVPADRELQTTFSFGVTWGDEPAHAIAFHPLVDNRKVTADLALYTTDQNGARQLLYDWLPGGDETRVVGPNVGFALPSGSKALLLEAHYWNTTQPSQSDRSGVAVCLLHGESRLAAGVVDLGVSNMKVPKYSPSHVVSRTCTFASPQYTVLVNAAPGMHRLGTRFSLKVEKADGTPKVVIDRAYRFGERVGVDFAASIEKGDRITTTCTYNNSWSTDVVSGWRMDEELCRVNVTYYPAGDFPCE